MNSLIEKQLYDYLENFLNEIKKSFQIELKELIENKYKNIRELKYLEELKENIYCYKEHFLGEIDDLDKLFEESEITLLEGINISKLWKDSDKDNKNAIIQYLKVFIFIFESCNKEKKEDNKFEDLLKDSLLNNEEHLKDFYNKLNDNKDNSIINLAQNIASELQSENNLDGNIMNLMNNNGGGLNNLISK